MHYFLIAPLITLALVFCQVAPAQADTRIGVSIGLNVPAYPQLVPIPGYPVYYDPYASANYFFYDGLYWVYIDDHWYSSSWYDGPWILTEPVYVPVYVLRVPVRYYRRPPAYFHGWVVDAPPRWGYYWGPSWEARRRGWDHWDHRYVPQPAPLPAYQRKYSGKHYPRKAEQQHAIRTKNYNYRPHERATREQFQQQDRLRTQPEGQPQTQHSQTEPQYFRGGQGTPDRRDNAISVNPGSRNEPQIHREHDSPTASQQTPISGNNSFKSYRGSRHDREYREREYSGQNQAPANSGTAPADRGQESRAASQMPSSQHNRFESGRSPGDRYGPLDTGSARGSSHRGWDNGSGRSGNRDGGNHNRGAGQNRR